MPERILFVSDDPAGRGGTEIRLIQDTTRLAPGRWRTTAVVPARGHLHDLLTRAGVDTRVLNFYHLPRFWRARKVFPVDTWLTLLVNGHRFRRLLEREGIALVNSVAKETLIAWHTARVAQAAGVPMIWSCGDTNPRVLAYCRRGLGRRVDRVIASSHHVKATLLEAGMTDPKRIEVVHNAMDLVDWDAGAASSGTPLRDELGISRDRPVVALIGRLDPVKGQREFLLAAERVARVNREVLFLLVGIIPPRSRWAPFADYYGEVQALMRRPDLRSRVLVVGWRTDLPNVMAAPDIVVQPSLRETFGRVLIEAMAARKPVVVTRIGGMPEIVVDGETGLIVPPSNPDALAAAILTLLRDPERRRAMGRAGRSRVEASFSLSQRTRRLEAIYEDVLRRRRGDLADTRAESGMPASPAPRRGAGIRPAGRVCVE
jgi:glycosyltransferase involved in cell wall biosynthesis